MKRKFVNKINRWVNMRVILIKQIIPLTVLLSITGALTYLIIFQLKKLVINQSLLFDYINSLANYLKQYPQPLIIILLVTFFVLFRSFIGKKRKIGHSKYSAIDLYRTTIKTIIFTVLIACVSVIFALGITFLVAVVDLNLLSFQMKSAPQNLGITTEGYKVKQQLDSYDSPPLIIVTNHKDLSAVIEDAYLRSGGRSQFYSEELVKHVPKNFVSTMITPDESIILVKGTLVLTEPKINDLLLLSPRIGYLFVKNFFSPRFVKSEPDIHFLGRQDYLKVRDEQIDNQVAELDKYVEQINNTRSEVSRIVANDEAKIILGKQESTNAITNKGVDYANCMAEGYYSYYTGAFTPYFTSDYCKKKAEIDWDSVISQLEDATNSWDSQRQQDQKVLDALNYIKELYDNYRSLAQSQKGITPQELGVFHNQNKIDIALDWINSKSVPALFETLVHEYLHYASYVSGERTLPPTFEEGLTEYYARQIIEKQMHIKLNIGYPLLVKVMEQIAKKVPKNDLENIYFSKDRATLPLVLDNNFGDKFYEDNRFQFEMLPYLPAAKALEFANNIMQKIGGQKLNENDLKSDFSFKD